MGTGIIETVVSAPSMAAAWDQVLARCDSQDPYSGDWNTVDGCYAGPGVVSLWEAQRYPEIDYLDKGTALALRIGDPVGESKTFCVHVNDEYSRSYALREDIINDEQGKELLDQGYHIVNAEFVSDKRNHVSTSRSKLAKSYLIDGRPVSDITLAQARRIAEDANVHDFYEINAIHTFDEVPAHALTFQVQMSKLKSDMGSNQKWYIIGAAAM